MRSHSASFATNDPTCGRQCRRHVASPSGAPSVPFGLFRNHSRGVPASCRGVKPSQNLLRHVDSFGLSLHAVAIIISPFTEPLKMNSQVADQLSRLACYCFASAIGCFTGSLNSHHFPLCCHSNLQYHRSPFLGFYKPDTWLKSRRLHSLPCFQPLSLRGSPRIRSSLGSYLRTSTGASVNHL